MQSKNEFLNKIQWLETDIENLQKKQKNNTKYDTTRDDLRRQME